MSRIAAGRRAILEVERRESSFTEGNEAHEDTSPPPSPRSGEGEEGVDKVLEPVTRVFRFDNTFFNMVKV